MKKNYIIPRLSEIKIDCEIALRLTSEAQTMVREPGSGGAGAGGESNQSGETGWERTGSAPSAPTLNDFDNAMWKY